MIKKITAVLLLALFMPTPGFAIDEVTVKDYAVQNESLGRYEVTATLCNRTRDSREVTLRAQIFFFEKASPKGDKPAMILRKDETVVLFPEETRKITVPLLNEGSFPKARLRVEPEVRIRRQRVWNY